VIYIVAINEIYGLPMCISCKSTRKQN